MAPTIVVDHLILTTTFFASLSAFLILYVLRRRSKTIPASENVRNGTLTVKSGDGVDIIIVGAGVAGAALAHTLGKVSSFQIELLPNFDFFFFFFLVSSFFSFTWKCFFRLNCLLFLCNFGFHRLALSNLAPQAILFLCGHPFSRGQSCRLSQFRDSWVTGKWGFACCDHCRHGIKIKFKLFLAIIYCVWWFVGRKKSSCYRKRLNRARPNRRRIASTWWLLEANRARTRR